MAIIAERAGPDCRGRPAAGDRKKFGGASVPRTRSPTIVPLGRRPPNVISLRWPSACQAQQRQFIEQTSPDEQRLCARGAMAHRMGTIEARTASENRSVQKAEHQAYELPWRTEATKRRRVAKMGMKLADYCWQRPACPSHWLRSSRPSMFFIPFVHRLGVLCEVAASCQQGGSHFFFGAGDDASIGALQHVGKEGYRRNPARRIRYHRYRRNHMPRCSRGTSRGTLAQGFASALP
jgi:hypothetical protein